MEIDTITEEADTETRLQKAFERMIEIKHQGTLLDAEEQSIKDDAFDYLTGVAHTTSGRFVANEVTADVYVSFRPQSRTWMCGKPHITRCDRSGSRVRHREPARNQGA